MHLLNPDQALRLLYSDGDKSTQVNDTARAALFASQMMRDEWLPGTVITVDAAGRLIDGRHICKAVLLAHRSIHVQLRVSVNGAKPWPVG